MGQNKALLALNGQTLIERIIAAIPSDRSCIKIVTNSPSRYAFLGQPLIQDVIRHKGPIGGVYAGLVDSTEHFSFFLACDLPFISQEVITAVLGHHREQAILCVRATRGFEPLCAIYSKDCVPVIEEQIRGGEHSLQSLISRMPSETLEIGEPTALMNVNTEEDWRWALKVSS